MNVHLVFYLSIYQFIFTLTINFQIRSYMVLLRNVIANKDHLADRQKSSGDLLIS